MKAIIEVECPDCGREQWSKEQPTCKGYHYGYSGKRKKRLPPMKEKP